MSTLRSTLSYYYHYDGLGSMITISDESGNTIERYEYSVYGKVNIVAKQNGERREVPPLADRQSLMLERGGSPPLPRFHRPAA